MNLLKYRRHFTYQDSWGSGGSEGTAGSMNSGNSDNSSQGGNWGRENDGIDTPNPTPTPPAPNSQRDADMAPDAAATSGIFTPEQTQQAQNDPIWNGLGGMFNSPYANYNTKNTAGYTTGSDFNVQTPGQVQGAQTAATSTDTPSLWSRWGFRAPGTTAEQFFNTETPSQQADRMGLVGNTIGAIGQAAFNTAMPGAMKLGLGLAKAYDGYSNGTLSGQQAAGRALAAFPGYTGAIGSSLTGDYGGAVAKTLAGLGYDKGIQTAGSLATNTAMGKDTTSQSVGLASYYAGVQLGGPVGGVFAQQLGKSLASVFGKK